MSSLEKIWALSSNDLRLLVRDKRMLLGILCLTVVGAIVFGIAHVSYGIALVLVISAVLLAAASDSSRVITSLSSGYRKSVPGYVPGILVTLLILAVQSALYAGIIFLFGANLIPSLWLIIGSLILGSAIHTFTAEVLK